MYIILVYTREYEVQGSFTDNYLAFSVCFLNCGGTVAQLYADCKREGCGFGFELFSCARSDNKIKYGMSSIIHNEMFYVHTSNVFKVA